MAFAQFYVFLIDDDNSESFFLVNPVNDESPSALDKENVALKTKLDALQTRLTATERVMHLRKMQDQQLRDSIMMARHEVACSAGSITASLTTP
jgi:hypothetical protein